MGEVASNPAGRPSLADVAARLDEAARFARPIPQLEVPLTVEDAYEAQRLSIGLRYGRGERRLGYKMGLTSKAKMVQVGVSEMTWGRLTDAMMVEDGGTLSRKAYIHPRAEPEVAYLFKRRLSGRVSMIEAGAAIEAVAAGIEILDSRYHNFKFSLTDVIADNNSSSGLTVGPWHPPDADVANLGMLLSLDGQPVQIGSSAAILGHPLRAVVAAANLMALRGESLEPGDVLLAGSATAAEPFGAARHVRLEVERLGACAFDVGT